MKFLFNSNAAHLSGKLPAKQERQCTIAKSPQCSKEGEKISEVNESDKMRVIQKKLAFQRLKIKDTTRKAKVNDLCYFSSFYPD